MKRRILYLLLLLSPFLTMIAVNETTRKNIKEVGYKTQNIVAINSAIRTEHKCSWICHNDTDYCKNVHVKLAKPFFPIIDPIYFGIIHSLKYTGNYGLANIIFLVILLPLVMFILLVKSIQLQFKIKTLKQQ
jgi:hypothetical protein